MILKKSLDGITIQSSTEADLDYVLAAENHEDNSPYVAQWTREQHIAALSNEDILHVVIKANQSLAGYAIIAGLKDANQCIELKRIVITDKSKGIGRAVLEMIKQHAFVDLHAHRLWLDVRENNHRARAIYKAMGFVEEGLIRECIFKDNKYMSHYIMSILVYEYMK